MEALRRVGAGAYTIEESVPLADLVASDDPAKYLRPVDSMFTEYEAVTLTEKQALRCRNGNSFSIDLPAGTYRAYDAAGEFLMLAKVDSGVMSTVKSFFSAE